MSAGLDYQVRKWKKRMMAGTNILEDIEKKSQDIMRSNKELADKLKRNQDAIASFSDELESIRQDMGGKGMKPATKRELEGIKEELESKKKLIGELIDDLKPVESDIARREDTIDALQQRIKDQGRHIESLSQDLLENRRQVQQLGESNRELKKLLTEKETMLQVIKNRLTESATALRQAEQDKSRLHEEIDSKEKDVFRLKNRIGALEKRVHSTDEQNQKILYEMVRMKQRLKESEDEIAEKNRLLDSRETELQRSVESLRKEEEEKRLMIMKNHAKKVAVMNSAIASLKTKLQNYRSVIESKSNKEQALIAEFNRRMRDLISARDDITAEAERIEGSVDLEGDGSGTDLEQPMFSVPSPEEAGGAGWRDDGVQGEPSYSGAFPMPEEEGGPSRMDEIIPMIELAQDHGDSKEQIRHSLASSGYSSQDIDQAFSKLDL